MNESSADTNCKHTQNNKLSNPWCFFLIITTALLVAVSVWYLVLYFVILKANTLISNTLNDITKILNDIVSKELPPQPPQPEDVLMTRTPVERIVTQMAKQVATDVIDKVFS
uniref:Uncharacterized protein n=1 Tax=Cacopsylla melanoneura TaxID=428564 RepID=A0A8D8TU00_9HEMI